MKKAFFILVFILQQVLFCLWVVEAILSYMLVEPWVPQTQKQFTEKITSHWPRKIAHEKPADVFRILGLSDSFGVYGGASNYHYRLEALLTEKGRPVEVVNFSHPGYEPVDQKELLDRFGPGYEPDLVLLGFFVGNDFSNPPRPYFTFANIPVTPERGLAVLDLRHLVLREWWAGFLRVRERVRGWKEAGHEAGNNRFLKQNLMNIEHERLQLFRKDEPIQNLEHTQEQLQAMRQICQDMGAKLVMAVHPDLCQVDAVFLEELCAVYGDDPGLYDFQKPQAWLSDFCRENKIPFLDLLPHMLEACREEGCYLTLDTHYNEKGNRIAAEAIAGILTETME